MRLIDRLYDWLSLGPTPDCDDIFAAALLHAEPAWSERLVRILLRRGHEASWAALIGRYDRLDPGVRARLQEASERMQAGIALAFRSSAPEARANALLALEERPYARLAYLLPDATRDPAPRVRALAGRVWRKMADALLDGRLSPTGVDEASRQARETDRYQLVLALEETLRTFDLHKRLEVLETCLWFARDLGETLWKKLTSRRSRAGMAASEYLASWNHPRLAHFLVSALKRPAWRETAGRLLQAWRTVPQVTALLRESDLLDDPRIRQHLNCIQSPQWFTEVSEGLAELPPDLRSLAPRWVCQAGYREPEKTALLSRWLHGPDPRVHEAAVYALAETDDPGARALLKQAADSDSPLAAFARWSVSALDTDMVRAAIKRERTDHGRSKDDAHFSSVQRDEAAVDCATLWQACRRTPAHARGELIAALREHAEIWQAQLKSYLQSPDPRDRLLVLQVLSTRQLALRFRHDLEPLLNDPVEGIRQLAQTLVRMLSQQSVPPRNPSVEPRRLGAVSDEEARDQARRELRAALEQLSAKAGDPADADLIERVRELLREVYSEVYEPSVDLLREGSV
jgi:hypothetical protein